MGALIVLLGLGIAVPGGWHGLEDSPAVGLALLGALALLFGGCLVAGRARRPVRALAAAPQDAGPRPAPRTATGHRPLEEPDPARARSLAA
jgi:hypothetical protein